MVQNIVIGKPLVELYHLLGTDENDNSFLEDTVYEEERFLPKILAKYGFMKSTSEVRKNRKDLWRALDKVDFEKIKIGKKRLWIVVGE